MALAAAHIEAERRLRVAMERSVTKAWNDLPAYNQENVDQFLSRVVPTIDAGRRQSVALTDAYLARAMKRQPLGIDPNEVSMSLRAGASVEEVYTRPLVTVWGKLQEGVQWKDAVAIGLERAASAAAMDMQLAMRQTAFDVGQADDGINGWQRVPDGNACDLCLIASTQRYSTQDLMPIHNHCGCGIEPSGDGRSAPPARPVIEGDGISVAVVDHGELGPVLVNAADHFTHI